MDFDGLGGGWERDFDNYGCSKTRTSFHWWLLHACTDDQRMAHKLVGMIAKLIIIELVTKIMLCAISKNLCMVVAFTIQLTKEELRPLV